MNLFLKVCKEFYGMYNAMRRKQKKLKELIPQTEKHLKTASVKKEDYNSSLNEQKVSQGLKS